jgi:Phosphotransferase enzyme family
MLRTYHDIVEGFVPGNDARWRIGKCDMKPGQIIRHGDLGPWNTIWRANDLVALIDWDFAQPGERIEDLAQMAYYFVPLRGELGWRQAGFDDRPLFSERLQVLVSSYGMFDPQQVIESLLILLENDRQLVQKLGKQGEEPWVSFLRRGDIEESLKDSAWLEESTKELLAK